MRDVSSENLLHLGQAAGEAAGEAGGEREARMGVAVRIAAATDGRTLHEVAAATFALACPPGTQQEQIDVFIAEHLSEERFHDYLADENRELFIVENDGNAVGYTMLVYGEPADADVLASVTTLPTVELSKLYLLASQHGTGAAAKLMAATIDAARQRDVASVWLGVNQLNERANRFYQKNGFSLVGTKRFRVGEELHDDFVRECVF